MSELKTLKDLESMEIFQFDGDDFSGLHDIALIEDLKQEAIKLYKILDKVPYGKNFCLECGKMNKGQYCHEPGNHNLTLHSETGDIVALKGYLKWFYKLTEEDLNA